MKLDLAAATTDHDIDARRAALERALCDAELSVAWARTLRATPYFLDEARVQLRAAWEIVSCAQLQDVHRAYDEAEALVANVAHNARSVLPHAPAGPRPVAFAAPRFERAGFVLENARLRACVRRDGSLVELRSDGGPNVVRRGLRLAAYVDRPFRPRMPRVRVTGCEATADAVEIRYAFGRSLAVARVELDRTEPFLRVDLAVDWRERYGFLRFENELAFEAVRARFGTPHGVDDRAPNPRTKAERATFEAPGQRFARIDGRGGGLAFLALDTYGWSLDRAWGRTRLGHALLLRGPTLHDASADDVAHAFSFALLPFAGGTFGMGELEHAWERFARRAEVPMFSCDDPAILVTATKLADDGDGIIVRARECDGRARDVVLRCGARAYGAGCVDALERPIPGEVALQDGALVARFEPFGVRTFRVAVSASKPS